MSTPAEVTVVLERINRGDASAVNELLPLVYDELRRRAQQYMGGERSDHTLQATALVHEAFVDLAGREPNWQGSRHFFNAAAEAMRRILVDHARTRRAQKRGGDRRRADLADVDVTSPEPAEEGTDWEALDHALEALRREDERRYQVVMYRYFTGLREDQVAGVLGVSEKTVQRDWKAAKAYLLAHMAAGGAGPSGT